MYGPLNTPNNLRFTMRYNEGLPAPVPYTMTPSSAYDGFYVLAYATYLAMLSDVHEPTGVGISHAILALQPGGPRDPRVDVGPGQILQAFDLLRRERHADLQGAATSLDMDVGTGDVATGMVLECMRAVPRSSTFEPEEIAVVFSAARHEWRGRLECP
jgi:hypothetical protein